MLSSPGCWVRTPEGRQPILVTGDSCIVAGYVHNSDADPSVQGVQLDQEWMVRAYAHQGEGNSPAWIVKDTIGPMGPFPASGIMRTAYMLDLGHALSGLGIRATFAHCGVGGTSFDPYSPSLNPTNYQIRLRFFKAMLAQLPNHLPPILINEQAPAGTSVNGYVWALSEMVTALETDLGLTAPLKTVVVRCPYTCGYINFNSFAPQIAEQNAYVAAHPYSRIAYYDEATYCDDGTLVPGYVHGIHWDGPSGRKMAIGPDDSVTVSILTAIQQLLALT